MASAPIRFVRARLAEGLLPPGLTQTYTEVLELAEGLVKAGVEDDWLDWLTGSEELLKVGEYLLGGDPQSAAERTRDQFAIALARSFADHPEFDPGWAR